MTIVHGVFTDIAREGSSGAITFESQSVRPVAGGGMVTTTRQRIPLDAGEFETPELIPGPARIELEAQGTFAAWTVTIPDDVERVDIADLVDLEVEYPPQVIGQAQVAARAAREDADAAQAARTGAEQARDGARELRDETQGLVDLIPDLEIVTDWADLRGIPEVFPPESHTHGSADIADAQHGTLSNVIIRRDENGMFTVADPVEDTHPVSKAWAVAEISTAMDAATGMTPEQIQMLQDLADQLADGEEAFGLVMQQLDLKLDKASAVYSRDAGASVVRRNESGQIAVPSAPDSAEQATSRQWVESHTDDVDAATRVWTAAQVDALATLVDDQAGQITALQTTLTNLQTELSDHKAEAVTSDNIRTIRRSDTAPSNLDPAPTDQVTFVHEGMQED